MRAATASVIARNCNRREPWPLRRPSDRLRCPAAPSPVKPALWGRHDRAYRGSVVGAGVPADL